MSILRCIAPDWLLKTDSELPRVVEGEFTDEQTQDLNGVGYNIYYLPNYPRHYDNSVRINGSQIDCFTYVFVDMDLKDGYYPSKHVFIERLQEIPPSSIVDSGNGVHAYWAVSDLDAQSYLRLCRRLMRRFHTDEAVGQIFQLMRLPGTVNTKNPDDLKLCTETHTTTRVYTCEELDKALPALTHADEQHCIQHYNKTYSIDQPTSVNDKIPLKFAQLLRNNTEVKGIWTDTTDDRSKGDYRLGHIMFGNGFTKEEATSVLVNSAKALSRGPSHRISYATNIVDKIWIYEQQAQGEDSDLSESVEQILNKFGDEIKGTRFACHSYLDNTHHGFRLGQVIGLIAGSGVGKTSVALNMFKGFVENNPDYDHFFIPLEQTSQEIADRWKVLCGDDTRLHSKVHILSNYDSKGTFRALSLQNIQDYIISFQLKHKRKIGCVVIDHIGALSKKGKNGENQDLMEICHKMKAFAVQTNTMLVMQSQAPREKAGIGDLELNKDAAYGTVYFESYCDYLVTLWQPLKRCYTENGCPLVTAFKFCKIRHKKQHKDVVKEDVCYSVVFEPETELLRELTESEEKAFDFFLKKSTNKRKADRKTEVIPYVSARSKEVCTVLSDGSARSVSPLAPPPKLISHG